MLYLVCKAKIRSDGTVFCRRATEMYQHPKQLDVGSLYYINKGLYKVVHQIL